MVSAVTQSQGRKVKTRGYFLTAFLILSHVGHTVKYQFISLCLFPNSPVLNPEASFGFVLVVLVLCIISCMDSKLEPC